ncbi:hypothetical protein DQR93_23365 [Salmonella enterica subsp. enterica serovar Bovismorbificans]|uniref:hypothetical protein n=1 Tax=Salmonella enterica TaxID=28901 RepID=UPI0009B06659|nr:hypothetical protein [Salmonella enterica]EBV2166955.1 hypothetical protein [Salmonella enterica subsp. enterica serovar Eastbourne]EDW6392255.1 hypothetical protein [Salmonella enterica subsp. enterica serovar Java]EEI1254531.1 hypothetical protein [Salmonella enterica subsp. enterica]EAR9883018.1 hypothetical protein [Salmonella enterica]EAT6341197.1 hypothetical protein [Salmonella enterica]
MFSGTFVFLAFGEPPTSVEGTRDYSTDFFPPRYVKFHVTRIAVFYVAVFGGLFGEFLFVILPVSGCEFLHALQFLFSFDRL